MDNLSIILLILLSSYCQAQTLTFPVAATASPGSPSLSLQRNASGVMSGIDGVFTEGSTLSFSDVTEPATPTSSVAIYGSAGGLPTTKSNMGASTILNTIPLYSIIEWNPFGNNTTTVGSIGSSFYTNGTAAAIATAGTTAYGLGKKIQYTVSGSNFLGAGWTHGAKTILRGVNGEGGFLHSVNFAVTSTSTSSIAFIGLDDAINNSDITSTSFAGIRNFIGMGFDLNDANFSIIYNDNAGAPTKINLGSSFPTGNSPTGWYNLILYAPPSASYVYYRATNLNDGVISDGYITTELPDSTQLLSPRCIASTSSTTGPAVIQIGRVVTNHY